MTISESNWLDIGNLVINEIVGSTTLFIVLGLALLNYHLVNRSVPIQVNFMLSFLFIGMVISYQYNAFVWSIGLLVVGVIIYSLFPKFFKR